MNTIQPSSDHPIEEFRDEHWYLSNYGPGAASYDQVPYPTAEHAFAAAKSLDKNHRAKVEAAPSPAAAKALGRSVELRPDWEHVKVPVMLEILKSKFTRTAEIQDSLVGTGDRLLIEGNTWGDDFWGRYRRPGLRTRVGRNMLGKTLMQVRRELRPSDPDDPVDRWTRVAVTGHRPHDIEQPSWVRDELDRLAVKLRDQHATQVALTGLAIGSDTWWAQSAIAAELRLWGYQPFPGQGAKWTSEQRNENAQILEHLDRLVVVADRYENRFYADRNQLLIGDADAVIAVRDPEKRRGGTVSALRAYCPGMPVITVNVRDQKTTISRSFDPSVLPPRGA
ncbi:SLOG family protein [Nocardia sp. CNY236]|uniref:SLOG family protein n=1 Tax=Nocardia sp. CNY236 TaxID=1169152 RepID=UPI0004220BF6|nr:SLOG family protein [Nocardia sp. CNY236]